MYMIQRDRTNLLDAMLVAINANDKLMFNMQHNVIPLAAAKNMGIIGMKVFADGAMYTKPAEWSEKKEHVVRIVGNQALPSKALIQYTLTTPGVHLAIIGIGQVSKRYEECQLSNNLDAAQILPDGLTPPVREAIEIMARKVKEGNTNYFQNKAIQVTAPKEVTVKQSIENNVRKVTVGWSTAFAADAPLKTYEIFRDGNKVNEQDFTLQLTTDPLIWTETLNDKSEHSYVVGVTDVMGREVFSDPVIIKKA